MKQLFITILLISCTSTRTVIDTRPPRYSPPEVTFYTEPYEDKYTHEELGLVMVNGRPLMLVRDVSVEYHYREFRSSKNKQ